MPAKKKIPDKVVKPLDNRMLKVAEKIKELRQSAGFTSSETFSYQYELSRVHYWRLEKGMNLTLESLLKILDIHGITLEEFFKGMK